MRVAAVVPVKAFARAKQRLRARFRDADVEKILAALLSDVLRALVEAERVDAVRVLTDSREVAALAERAGASARVRDPDPGLNPTLDAAAAELEAQGYDALLIVLGDLPLLRGSHVDAVVEAGGDHRIVLVPAADGGTAMLFRRPPTCLPARFGPESADAHTAAARAVGLEPEHIALAADLRHDLDTPEDATLILATGAACETVAVLRKLLE